MRLSIRRLLRSLAFFTGLQFKKRGVDILFYYSAFYCKESGYNPYFKPLTEACEKAGISYMVLEEPHPPYENRKNGSTVPADLPFFISILLRKTLYKNIDDINEREQKIGAFLKRTLFRNLFFENYVTISQSIVGIIRGMDENVNIFDLQHGVLYSGHESIFDATKTVAGHIVANRIKILLYGHGFKETICRSDPTGYYEKNAIVIGHPFWPHIKEPGKKRENIVAVSMQFMDFYGECDECNPAMLKELERLIEVLEPYLEKGEIELVLKHHPRFDGEVSIESLLQQKGVSLCRKTSRELFERAFLHITFSSTTIFEAAASAVPTLLVETGCSYLPSSMYKDEFGYPLPPADGKQSALELLELHKDRARLDRLSQRVLEWADRFYSPFDPSQFFNEIAQRKRNES